MMFKKEPLLTVCIFLKSGQTMKFDNFTKFDIKSTGEEIRTMTWNQDLERGTSPRFFFCAIDQIAAITIEKNR